MRPRSQKQSIAFFEDGFHFGEESDWSKDLVRAGITHLRLRQERPEDRVQIQAPRRLGVIKTDTEGWIDAVRQRNEDGANFLLVFPNNPEEIHKFCLLFGLGPDCAPKTLTQSGLFRLGQFMEPEAFDAVLSDWGPDKLVVFVEQLDFPVNRPPRTQPFLVYSPVLGVLAQAATKALAKEALDDHQHHLGLPTAEASI